MQGRLVTNGERLLFLEQVVDHVLRVVKALQDVLCVVVADDAVLAFAVEIALVVGTEHALAAQHKLWCELLVFV